MNSAPAFAGRNNRTFLPVSGEKVFLCRSAAEKVSQLRSRIAQRLAVQLTVRLASSLTAALPGKERILMREGWAGEKDELFEQPLHQSTSEQ